MNVFRCKALISVCSAVCGVIAVICLSGATLLADDYSSSGIPEENSLTSAVTSRGALTARDLFPFSSVLPQFETSVVAPGDFIGIELATAWSNTMNVTRPGFVVDVETRLLEPKIGVRLSESSTLQMQLPLYWRGGGVLDEPIYLWHEVFGLPQGPRDNRNGRDNRFTIEAISDSGEEISLEERGFGLGDAALNWFYLLPSTTESSTTELWHTFRLGIQLPTSDKEYGLTRPAVTLGLQSTVALDWWFLHSAAHYSYLFSDHLGDFRLKPHQFTASLGAEFPFKSASAYITLSYHSDILSNVPSFPSYQIYFDTGIRIALSESYELDLLLRENPAPDTGTADVSGYLTIHYNY